MTPHDLTPRYDRPPSLRPRGISVRRVLGWIDAWRERRRQRRVRATIERIRTKARLYADKCELCGSYKSAARVGHSLYCSGGCEARADIRELEAQLAIETTKGDPT